MAFSFVSFGLVTLKTISLYDRCRLVNKASRALGIDLKGYSMVNVHQLPKLLNSNKSKSSILIVESVLQLKV